MTKLTFLGTGGAWRLPELGCDCLICNGMRLKKEERRRTALFLSGNKNILIDCGPDIREQLINNHIDSIDAILITHEHGDHYLGLDEMSCFKRRRPKGEFEPIPLFVTNKTWEVIAAQFSYLVDMGVLKIHEIETGNTFNIGEFEFTPFKTSHGPVAAGSVGFSIRVHKTNGDITHLVYTSDFFDLPETPPWIFHPDYLILNCYWLNEPLKNRANQLSFQRALGFIDLLVPEKEILLTHIGDTDMAPGDPANRMSKKFEPADPLRSPETGKPYIIPVNQEQWQHTADSIISDMRLPFKVTVAFDGFGISI
jgi:phosphoribosyl 1,2-cyclic phosphate phosphodiesterase